MRVLICGGRNFLDKGWLFAALDHYHAQRPFSVLIHGAASGADQWGDEWAKSRGVPVEAYPAEWTDRNAQPYVERFRNDGTSYNAAAGGIRNAKMLGAKPDLVIAFPGKRGTADMVKQSRNNNTPVLDLREVYGARGSFYATNS